MKKENDKTNTKKAITVRIDPEIITQYNEQLQTMYGKEHRKKSHMIEYLIEQFNHQPPETLKQYIEQEKQIINLNHEQIQELNQLKQDYQDDIKNLTHQLQEKEKHINQLEQSHQETLETTITSYKKQTQTLKDIIQEKDKIIDEYKASIKDKDKTINDKDITLANKDKTIEQLTSDKEQLNKDVKTARNDYKHSMESLNKSLTDTNNLTNELKDYAVAIAEIKKMSLVERILARYPKKILELPDNSQE